MKFYQATSVVVFGDYDHGEGLLVIQWRDKLYGTEGLSIDFDGHCSRNMPIRSGSGQYEVNLQRDSILIRFEPQLAAKLELDESVEIKFNVDDNEYLEIQKFFGVNDS